MGVVVALDGDLHQPSGMEALDNQPSGVKALDAISSQLTDTSRREAQMPERRRDI